MNSNIYTLFGNDGYIIKNNVKRIIKLYDVDEFNVNYYDMEEVLLDTAINDANTIPFMSDKKIVVIQNAYFLSNENKKSSLNHNIDKFINYLEKPLNSTVLIIYSVNSKIDSRRVLVKLLKKVSDFKEYNSIEIKDLASWVVKQTRDKGIKMNNLALEEFLRRTSYNTQIAVNEMKKLLLYIDKDEEITRDIVERIVTKNIEENIYELTNSLLNNDKEKTMEIYGDLIESNEDPMKLLGSIVSKFIEVLHSKMLIETGFDKSGIMSYYKCNSGRAYYIMKNANSISMELIKRYIDELEDLDYKIKTGQIEKNLGLQLFLLKA